MLYKFINPGKLKIAKRTIDQTVVVDTQSEVWRFEDGGLKFKIDWRKFPFDASVIDILKGFIFHRLEVMAPRTVSGMDYQMLRDILESRLSYYFPWVEQDVIAFANHHKICNSLYAFKSLYSWMLQKDITGVDSRTKLKLDEISGPVRNPYDKIFLRQVQLTVSDEFILVNSFKHFNPNDICHVTVVTLLQLAYELGPRPIQMHSLDITDFKAFKKGETVYYSINLPLAKKLRSGLPPKKMRSISVNLGSKIDLLIKLHSKAAVSICSALFKHELGARLSTSEISALISSRLKQLNILNGNATLLRHHLAQSMADNGASSEMIAEIMGHNSTVAARAYVGATPAIGEIKTKALGKNDTYLAILKMLLTGEVVAKEYVDPNTWVKGEINGIYIGGIGSCGLAANTSCPKNPVYSCYTCKKFHPFVDGQHQQVKGELQKQATEFVQASETANDIGFNKVITQLELTIEAVSQVIIKLDGKTIQGT